MSHGDRLVISENIVIITFPIPDLNLTRQIWSEDAGVYVETIDIFTCRNYKRFFDLMFWKKTAFVTLTIWTSDRSKISQRGGGG